MYRTSSERVSIRNTCRVPLHIRETVGRGRGVFAAAPVGRGELVERAPVIVIPEGDRAAVDASSVGSYIFMWEHDTVGEDIYSQRGRAALVLGFAGLVNHSEVPNCAFIRYIEALALDVIALRDIAEGEELSFNYGMTLWFTPK